MKRILGLVCFVFSANVFGTAEFMVSIFRNEQDKVQSYLSENPDVVNRKMHGWYPLHMALSEQYGVWLSDSIDGEYISPWEHSPGQWLHGWGYVGYLVVRRNVVKILLDHGADINLRNRRGETPLQELLNRVSLKYHPANYFLLVELLIERGAYYDESMKESLIHVLGKYPEKK